jgi:putative FmdB family regulatory protein
MPTYEYVCVRCGHSFELFHSINAKPDQSCPRCGGHVERKISGGTGLLFKGSGFYITDYKKDKAKTSTEKPETTKEKPQKKKKEEEAA